MRERASRIPVREAERLLLGPAAGLKPVLLAAGPEEFLRERLTRACRAGAEAEGAEFQRLEGDTLDAETLAGALGTLALFGGARRIWIRECSKMAGPVEETVLEWAGAPQEGVFVLLTTARDAEDLSFLKALASRAAAIPCALQGSEGAEWAEQIAREEGLKLPARTCDAILDASLNLLAYRQEIRKLAAHADPDGRVKPEALDAVRRGLPGASIDRWAAAVLAGGASSVRAETEALVRDGVGGTAALWAIAERALGALEPQAFFYRRAGAADGPPLAKASARAALDAVYRADRGLKRGDLRDSDLVETLVSTVRRAIRG
ncbi:MAG: hypothetical protein HY568_01080 [Candidatus Latescibacteria bacterium]|nr:hypothetical protein [Candidatus Latescibacterota bacterium]